jgi:hypothetical protein
MALATFIALAGTLACQSAPVQTAPSQTAKAVESIRGIIGVGTWSTQAEFKDIKVTQGSKVLWSSDFTMGLTDWKTIRGKWEVAEGALRQTSSEEDTRAVIGNPTWSDYTLTLKARKISGNEGFLILFGLPDEHTLSWWNVGGWGNTAHAIQAPGVTEARVPGRIETNRWYDLKVELSSNTVRTFLDNQLVNTATQPPGTHTLVFDTRAPGKKMRLTHWGLDTAWAVPEHVRRGILYTGKDQVDTIRVSFPIRHPLVNGELPDSIDHHFKTRLEIAKMAGDVPLTMLPDTEAGVHPWYKDGNAVNPERWVQLMAAAQRKYGKKMESVEPFNEADYGWGQGNAQNLNNILGVLRNNPEFAGVQIVGPSTLNSNAALPWYNVIKGHVDRGSTHALGGGMESFINFYKQVVADGKVADQSELHNIVEAIAGAEYGLQSGIWWALPELSRGEFVKAVQGERLAYSEDRPQWSAAAVYRAPGGKVQAFLGSSERQGQTATYRFVSRDRAVFFDGDGPRREYSATVRRHGERVINITWGQDVQPKIGGRYAIVNRHTGKVLAVTGASQANGASVQQMDYKQAAHQQWEVARFVAPYGDQSYFNIRAVHSKKSLDTADWNHDEGGKIQQWGEGDAGAQHWYFDYAGDNYFYIRSRWSTKCLEPAGGSKAAGTAIVQTARMGDPRQQWRLVPVSAGKIEFNAPRQPTRLTAIAKPDAVQLRWKANSEADVAGYTVFRSTTVNGPYDTIARGMTGNTFTDEDAKDRRKYFYKIKAVDRCLNQSAFSKEASATPGSGSATP